MRALQFRHELLRYLVTRGVHTAAPRLWSVRLAPLYRTEIPLPVPSRPGWVRLRVRRSGICGSDVSLVTGADSLALEPEVTYPFVPGHEVVGTIDEYKDPGRIAAARRLATGQRVAVWPILGCRARALEPCASCVADWEGLCTKREGGWPGHGLSIGFNHDTGGGWAEACLAHESQLWPIPSSVSDEDAVLLDAAASALAAVLRGANPRPSRSLVIGGGTIGLLAAYLDRILGVSDERSVLVRHEVQGRLAERCGVPAALVRTEEAWHDWAADRGIASRRVLGYGPVYRGVFDRVIVAAASRTAVEWALRSVAPGGSIAMLAAPAGLKRFDPTLLWYREVTIAGHYAYGPVPWEGVSMHPYEVLIPRLASGELVLRDFVTHTFALDDYVAAFAAATHQRGDCPIKVTFHPAPS